jgi:hypothetical protein
MISVEIAAKDNTQELALIMVYSTEINVSVWLAVLNSASTKSLRLNSSTSFTMLKKCGQVALGNRNPRAVILPQQAGVSFLEVCHRLSKTEGAGQKRRVRKEPERPDTRWRETQPYIPYPRVPRRLNDESTLTL